MNFQADLAALADTFDLLVDLGVRVVFRFYGLVPRQGGTLRDRAIDLSATTAAGRVVGTYRTMATIYRAASRTAGRIRCSGAVGPRRVRRLCGVSSPGRIVAGIVLARWISWTRGHTIDA